MFLFLPLPSVYSGHQSILVPPLELESNVSLWLSAVSQYKVRVTFCSYSVMEMCTKGLGMQTDTLRVSGLSFSGYWHTNTCIFLKVFHFGLQKMSHKCCLESLSWWLAFGEMLRLREVSALMFRVGKKKKVLCFQLYLFVPHLCCWVFLRLQAKCLASLLPIFCLRQKEQVTKQKSTPKKNQPKAPLSPQIKKPLPPEKTKQKAPQNLASLTCFQISWHQKYGVLKWM